MTDDEALPALIVAGMPVQVNILVPLLPIPFYIGLPGFRSKRWLVDDSTGGYYEWDTIEDAENYSKSFAARFMTSRAVPGSVRFKVYPAGEGPVLSKEWLLS